jgi:hypothetical protein
MRVAKITLQVRRLLSDPEYYRAMQMLMQAHDELRTIEQRNRPQRNGHDVTAMPQYRPGRDL